ncbi:MAG: DUF6049 family protein [Actinobacteria bacterium]|nr:DUF6049 family protein [Actinomycetota bacterium]
MRWRTITASVVALVITMGSLSSVSAAAGSPALRFRGQSTWVAEASTNQPGRFTLSFSGPDDATVSATVFPRITTRSGFQATLASAPNGAGVDHSAAIPLRCLQLKNGNRLLHISIFNGAPRKLKGSISPDCQAVAPASWSLPCSLGNCSGVWPVVVNTKVSGEAGSSFTTFITLTAANSGSRLRTAVVFNLKPTLGQRDAATRLLDVIHASASSATVLYSPNSLINPDGSVDQGPYASALANVLGSGDKQLLASSFVPVDAGGLSDAGLHGELSPLRSHAYTKAVVADAAFSPPLESTSSWGEPFKLSTGGPSILAISSDSGLAAELAHARRAPLLAAYQMLADLAFLHFEQPYLRKPRAALAVDPGTSPLSPLFTSTLLKGLSQNPVLESVTLRKLFREIPPGSNGAPATRKLQLPRTSVSPSLARSIATARAQLQSLRGAALHKPLALSRIGDQLLAAESSLIGAEQGDQDLASVSSSIAGQLSGLEVSAGTITLTAHKGTIPITITSTLNYPIRGVLSFTSDKLAFSSATTRNFTIARSTHAIRIGVRARTTGDIPLEVRFTAPDGLLLASGTITVRSTASSIVGMVITILAAAVLALWWVRNLRRRRKQP